MSAVVIGGLGLHVGQRKFVAFRIDRNDLPHLTFSWGNPSGEVDVHLTPASPRDENDREAILRIQESALKLKLGELLKQAWELFRKNPLQMVWCVQPRWLAKHGYVLISSRNERVTEWLKRALPKQRGKHRLDANVLKQLPKMAFYEPTRRHFTEIGQEGQIYAVCEKGPQRGRMLVLQPLSCGFDSSMWMAVDFADAAALIKAARRRRLLPQWFASLVPGAWERIYAALELRQVGL